MKTKERFYLITLIVLIAIGIYLGATDQMEQDAKAEEQIVYTVQVMENTKYGYVPKYDFEMSKPTLEAHIKLCWWDSAWLNSGDLLLRFDMEENVWLVKLQGNDPEIRTIRGIANDYGLRCKLPD